MRKIDEYIASLDTEPQQIEAMARCINSFEFWCDHFAYTFDPRKDPSSVRFVLYDYQRDAAKTIIQHIDNGGIIHLDKSRDMGASWLMMAIFTWKWLFAESFHAHVGSRVEKLVDNYTVDSLFGKVDYLLERLPVWMVPEFVPRKHRKQLQILSPRENLISGESSNPHFGRGPRKNVVYLDEFSQWENDYAVWTGIGDTAPCRIVTSTPMGEGNMFARLRKAQSVTRITLHWTLHPEKDEEWYKAECAKRDKVAIAQELDIDYVASAGGLALPELTEKDVTIPSVEVTSDENTGCKFFMGLDYGSTNPTSINVYRVRTLAESTYKISSIWEYYEPSNLYKISEAIKKCPWYSLVTAIYADPSMWFYNQHDAHGQRGVTSLAFLLRDEYNIHVLPGRRGDTYALEQLKKLVRDDMFEISVDCPNQLREFQNLRYQVITDRMSHKKNVPEKLVDKDNHSWDNFKYFFNSYFEKPEAPEIIIDPPMGYEALRMEFEGVKAKKLLALTRPNRLRRRVFRYR